MLSNACTMLLKRTYIMTSFMWMVSYIHVRTSGSILI